MALTSGIPVPAAYVLDREAGINAFAAGYRPEDAVVAVTDGCLRRLSRDELQGVVAHEFSHILNGDMRLNIRLIGMISGILVIAAIGRLMMRPGARTRSKNEGAFMLVGIAFMAIGYIGVLAARILQSAISRQREFLADASAVQFTRNPSGIANALKKIGGFARGSKIKSPRASETSHMFFSTAISTLFATHPALIKRIRRIDPAFSGTFPEIPDTAVVQGMDAAPVSQLAENHHLKALSTDAARQGGGPDPVKSSLTLLESIPGPVRTELNNPLGASAVVFALLLDADAAERGNQIGVLTKMAGASAAAMAETLQKSIAPMDPRLKLPLLDLALPVLRQFSAHQYQEFSATVKPWPRHRQNFMAEIPMRGS